MSGGAQWGLRESCFGNKKRTLDSINGDTQGVGIVTVGPPLLKNIPTNMKTIGQEKAEWIALALSSVKR
jgi:hypothetical protein